MRFFLKETPELKMPDEMRALVLALIISSLLPRLANAHAGLVSPVSRNSMDRNLPAFAGGRSPNTPCTCANGLQNRHRFDDESSTCWYNKNK